VSKLGEEQKTPCESAPELGGFGVLRQELQGNTPFETNVLGAIDNTHPALSEFFEYPAMRDSLAAI